MKVNEIYLSLGSNIENRYENLKKAITQLKNKVLIKKLSEIYESEPVEYLNQGNFLNMVLYGKTKLTAHELLKEVKKIELKMGRIKKINKGPRNIDIDILFYNKDVFKESDLKIPHQSIQNRNFVLIPLLDINPNFTHPTEKKTIKQLTTQLKSINKINKWTKK